MAGSHDVQPGVFADAAVVGVEVGVVPVLSGAGGDLLVLPEIVGADRDDVVFRRGLEVIGDVEAEGGYAVFVAAEEFAVEVDSPA